MTACQLVTALLDEGEDPKDFLRRHAPRLRMPKSNEVDYDAEADWETDIAPEDSFDDAEAVMWVRDQIGRGNVWGWANVTVTASFTTEDGETVEAHEYLGGCSYRSKADFMEPGGYYDDMKIEAYNELCKKLEKLGYKEV